MNNEIVEVELPNPKDAVGKYTIFTDPNLSVQLRLEIQLTAWESAAQPMPFLKWKPAPNKFIARTWKVTGYRKFGNSRWKSCK